MMRVLKRRARDTRTIMWGFVELKSFGLSPAINVADKESCSLVSYVFTAGVI